MKKSRKFEIQKDLEQLNRNRNGIEQIYQGKQGNIQKRNSLLLAAVSLVITVSTVVEVIQAALSEISKGWPQLAQDIINKYLIKWEDNVNKENIMYSHFYDLRKISCKLSKKTLPLTACIPFFDSKI